MSEPNLLPEELRNHPATQEAIASLKDMFIKNMNNCVDMITDSDETFNNEVLKPMLRVYIANLAKTAFDKAYLEFIMNIGKG